MGDVASVLSMILSNSAKSASLRSGEIMINKTIILVRLERTVTYHVLVSEVFLEEVW